MMLHLMTQMKVSLLSLSYTIDHELLTAAMHQMDEADGTHGMLIIFSLNFFLIRCLIYIGHSVDTPRSHANVKCETLSGKLIWLNAFMYIAHISTESSGEYSDWSADERCCLKLKQMQREIITGNYNMDNHLSTPPLDFPFSEEDEEQATDTGKMSDVSHKKTKNKTACPAAKAARPFVSTSGMAGGEGSDADDEGENTQSFKPGRLLTNAIQKVQALGKCMTEEALSIANEYGKSLGTIMAAAGLSTKATQTKSV